MLTRFPVILRWPRLARPSKDAAEVATPPGPSSFAARCRSHLRMTGNKVAPWTTLLHKVVPLPRVVEDAERSAGTMEVALPC